MLNTNVNYKTDDNSETVDFNEINNNSDYLFIKTKDHYGDDIDYKKNLSLEEMIFDSDLNENCICFNTLGFFKNKVDMDSLIDLNTGNPDDGIYVNIKRYRAKYNKNIYNDLNKNNIESIVLSESNLSENNINKEINTLDYLFIKTKDHYGDDIDYKNNLNLEQMMLNSILNENCICFNTLGFFKNKVDMDNLIDLNTDNSEDGLYINIKRYNEKYNKNIYIEGDSIKNDTNDIISESNIINANSVKVYDSIIDIKNIDSLPELESNMNNENIYPIQLSDNSINIDPLPLSENNVNVKLFFNNENINSAVNYEKYIKYHYTDFSIKIEYINFIEDYLVLEKSDFIGNDVEYKADLSIRELMELANNIDHCDSFNTAGFFKNNININGITKNDYIIHNNVKIFIKINKLYGKNKFLILKNINTLNIDYKYSEEFNEGALVDFMEDNEHIAYNSYGYLIKYSDTMFENLLKINEAHNNYMAIDVVKLYNIQKKNKIGVRVKIIDNLFNNDLNKFSMGSLKWNDYEFVFTDSFVDYYVILGDPNNKTYYNPNKTITINSNETNNNFYKNIKCNIAFWKNNKNYVELKYTNNFKKYDKIICNLFTNNSFIDYINSRKSDFLDNIDDNYQSIFDYKYVIISDKNNIWDALLAETFCFYIGDDDISEYISSNVFIKIDSINEEESYNTIINLITENIWEKNIDTIKKEKENILDYYNLFPTIQRIIENK